MERNVLSKFAFALAVASTLGFGSLSTQVANAEDAGTLIQSADAAATTSAPVRDYSCPPWSTRCQNSGH